MVKIINTVSCDRDDWRFRGQDEYLNNITLIKSRFAVKDPAWNHEHCDFCMDTFSECEGDLHEGYHTQNEKFWICEKCFHDFAHMFNWNVNGDVKGT